MCRAVCVYTVTCGGKAQAVVQGDGELLSEESGRHSCSGREETGGPGTGGDGGGEGGLSSTLTRNNTCTQRGRRRV